MAVELEVAGIHTEGEERSDRSIRHGDLPAGARLGPTTG
jgi:hypothetical protein